MTRDPVDVHHPPANPRSATNRRPLGPIVRLADVAAERVRWLSPGRLAAGKVTVLEGDPGLGKSTLLGEFAARVTRGQPLPDGQPGAPRAVVLMSAEDDLRDTVRPRIDVAGGDPDQIISFATLPNGGLVVIPRDTASLELIVGHTDAALVIIDPLVAFLDRRLSANRDQDVRAALLALNAVAEQTGAAIVVVRHLNKSSSANPLYRGGGSIGIIGAARCGLIVARDPDDPDRRILAPTKANLALPPASLAFYLRQAPAADVTRVVWDGVSHWSASDLLLAAAERERSPRLIDEARTWLRQRLAAGPRPATTMQAEAEAQGFSAKTLARARRAERVAARKERGPHGRWLWTLPAATGQDGHSSR